MKIKSLYCHLKKGGHFGNVERIKEFVLLKYPVDIRPKLLFFMYTINQYFVKINTIFNSLKGGKMYGIFNLW